MVPDSEDKTMVGKTDATPEPPAIAAPEPAAIARPEPTPIATPESTPITTLEPAPIAKPELAPMTMPEPEPVAKPESTPMTMPEPEPVAKPESPPINRVPPHIEKVVATDRAGFLFADSDARYLTRAELQKLSADRLHIARNEIFARRGRYFKDDALRTYFSQFPWYQPHAWDVPLSPAEQANVKLIQSLEQTASTPRQASRAWRVPPM